ncbi:hypothetical protein L0F63_001370 [Massospora cicadina]|nr:hypothetical protein L0F63_001370 [Massospora cicadina]
MLGKSYANQADILNEARSLAQEAGFAVVTRNSSKSTLYLMCACGGQPRRKKKSGSEAGSENGESDAGRRGSRKRVSIRCGCPFLLGANLRKEGIWYVSKVDERHNHALVSHPYIFQLHKSQNEQISPRTSFQIHLSPEETPEIPQGGPAVEALQVPPPQPSALPHFKVVLDDVKLQDAIDTCRATRHERISYDASPATSTDAPAYLAHQPEYRSARQYSEGLPASAPPTSLIPMARFIQLLGLDPSYNQCISQFKPSQRKNSGFQALAHAVFKDETKFRELKCEMAATLTRDGKIYQQLYWCDMPRLVTALQSDEAFYCHDCPQLAANTLGRPVACFPCDKPPTLFLPLSPPASPTADIFPVFLGQVADGAWVLLEVPRSAPFVWPPSATSTRRRVIPWVSTPTSRIPGAPSRCPGDILADLLVAE